jgi:hypothetical protein
MSCAFCRSDAPLTKEHLWPDWVSNVVVIPGDVTHRQRFVTAGENPTIREYSRPPWRVKVGAVCAECNNGWMSRLESEAKRHAESILLGRAGTTHRAAQMTLAMWATVKVLIAEYTVPPEMRFVPSEHYSLVYNARDTFELPSESFEVHTAAYGGRLRPAFYDRTGVWLDTTEKTTGQSHRFAAFIATFTIGRLALRTLGHTVPEAVHLGLRSHRAASVQRIHPYEGSFVWPPGPPLDEIGLDWFATGPAPSRP